MYYAPLPLTISVANSRKNYSAIAAKLMITAKSSNFVTGSKFPHPSSEFLWLSAKFILKDIKKKIKNTISFKQFFLLMLFHAKIEVIWCSLKFCTWSLFVTKLNLKTSKNLPKTINKEASSMTVIHMKFSSKILKRKIVFKKWDFFSILMPFFGGGVTKLEAFQWCFVTKFYPIKPSPFYGKFKIIFHFWYYFSSFKHLLVKYYTFWSNMNKLYI